MMRLVLAGGFLVSLAPTHADAFTTGVLEIHSDSDVIEFQIEIADEPDERSRGLMFRRALDDDAGMLFIYPEPRIASFWMKNTLIPLDMLFIDAEGRIVKIEPETTPFSLDTVPSETKVIGVLEIEGGDAARLGIEPGDQAQWTEFPPQQ